MKKSFLLILVLFTIQALYGEKLLHKTLNNGMEVVVQENFSNNSIGYYCYVKTGSSDEGVYLGDGLSHYLEHLVSGGSTKNNTEKNIQARQKAIGVSANAYTNSQMTCYYLMANKSYSDEIRKMLIDNLFNAALPQKEFDREKNVIIKEFVYRVATPQARLRHKADVVTFMDAHAKYQVIGYVEQFKKVTHKEIVDYYQKKYKPNNMVFVACGNFDADEEMSKLEKDLSIYARGTVVPENKPSERIRFGDLKFVNEFDVKKPRVYISKVLNRGDYQDFIPLEVATEILFGKRKSPIPYTLKEKMNKVNYIWGFFNDGSWYLEPLLRISFEANDVSQLDGIVNTIDSEIEKVKEDGVTKDQIKEFINSYKATHLLKQPTISEDSNNIGNNMFSYGVPKIYDYKLEQFEKVTVEDINRVIKKYFTTNNRVVFYGVPKGTKAQIEKTSKKIVKSKVTKIKVDDDISLIYKQNSAKPIIKGMLNFPVGSVYEDISSVGTLNFMLEMMFRGGSSDYSSMEISDWLENHAVTLDYRTREDGLFIGFTCIKDDYKKLSEILEDVFNNPEFDKKELKNLKKEYDASFERGKDYPDTEYSKFRNGILYKDTKGALTPESKNDIIQDLTTEDLEKLHKKFFKNEKFIVTLYGDITKKEAIKMADDLVGMVPKGKIDSPKKSYDVGVAKGRFVNKCDFEQVQVDVNYKVPRIDQDDYYTVKVIESILGGGFGGRILTATRVDDNLVYSAWGYATSSKHRGFFRLSGKTSIPNRDKLVTTFDKLINDLKVIPVSKKELESSLSSYEKQFKNYVTDKNLVSIYSSYESQGLGYNYREKELVEMKKVTIADIQRVAKKYFVNPAIVISQPDESVLRSIE